MQVSQNSACLHTRLLEHFQQRNQLLLDCGILGRRQLQLTAALLQTLGDFLEGIEVLAQQKDSFGAHTFSGQELVGRLTDALRQHDQLAHRSDLGCGCILLYFDSRNGLGDVQHVGRLSVDKPQPGADLRQHLLLAHDDLGFGLGTIDQRHHFFHLVGIALRIERAQTQFVIAGFQTPCSSGQHPGTLGNVGERLGTSHQRLRYRLGQTL